MNASVYLDRKAIKDTVLTLLIPSDGPERRPTVFATGTEINGGSANPASLDRVYRCVEQQSEYAHLDPEEDAEDVQDELEELFGADVETADPEADRMIAHQIIKALAAAYPLPASDREALPVER
ncbi:hypothetical protein [Streptomyces sp. NPDC048638]|uniref:hypothetical protein n=1 Tax=Streptomyces sp. NPDC048638 TaxID=3365580 RepID=UPI003710BE26